MSKLMTLVVETSGCFHLFKYQQNLIRRQVLCWFLQALVEVFSASFGGGLMAGNPITAGQFRIGSEAQDVSDRFIFNSRTGTLFYNADDLGGAAKVQLATLQTDVVLRAANTKFSKRWLSGAGTTPILPLHYIKQS